MGVISQDYIMKLLKEYAKTEAGKQRIADEMSKTFNGESSGVTGGITRQRVDEILNEIRDKFVYAVQQVIASFRGEGVHAKCGRMSKDGSVKCSIVVDEDALRRESLHYINSDDMTIRRGSGVDDILALFTHGYTIHNRPYGFWVRDESTSSDPINRIGALMHREPNPFLKKFTDEMNTEYGSTCVITLNGKYLSKGGE